MPLTKVMAFVDGGYLRRQCADKFDDEIDYQALKDQILENFNANVGGNYHGDLVRVYYYDALLEDASNPKFHEQIDYFNKIESINGFEIHLGKLVPTGKNGDGPLKQKGVDVLLAVDMLSKAYNDQFEFAVLIAGDRDFVNVVTTVKDSGKRVFGMYFKNHISEDLHSVLDARIFIDKFVNTLKQSK